MAKAYAAGLGIFIGRDSNCYLIILKMTLPKWKGLYFNSLCLF